jgi:hypothetical protein
LVKGGCLPASFYYDSRKAEEKYLLRSDLLIINVSSLEHIYGRRGGQPRRRGKSPPAPRRRWAEVNPYPAGAVIPIAASSSS